MRLIRFNCPHCDCRIKAPASRAGRKGRCVRCGQAITVPADTPESAKAAESAHRLLPAVTKHAENEEMIDMTAMVDIVFFLLIFFMVTSYNSQQASIEMPAPAPTAGAA